MSEQSYSSLIRTLVDDYVNNRISFEEYRGQRKVLLWKLDEEYNDIKIENSKSLSSELT